MKTRISIIDFLNAVPLQWGFTHGSLREDFELLFDVPSECALHLRRNQADVGLIPVIEYQRIPGLRILPGISIASKREVKSVLFVSRLPIAKVKRIAVDTSSRTSVALLRILLNQHFNNPEARFYEQPPEPERMLETYEAALVIGNPALRVDTRHLEVFDLANEWYRMTGLPFVFAFWAARDSARLSESAIGSFYQSRDEGWADLDRICSLYSDRLGLEEKDVRSYLCNNLDYSLDQDNLRGLRAFFKLSARWGIIESERPLLFHPQPQQEGLRAPLKPGPVANFA